MIDFLVTTDWLDEYLDEPDLRILDVTPMLTQDRVNLAREQSYGQGHIAHSLFFDVASGNGVLSDPKAALPWTWPTPEQFMKTMSEFGIANDTRVVIVARSPRKGIDSGTMWCTRAWWTMHHFGVDVGILRGGIEQWLADGYPLVTDPPESVPRTEFIVDDNWQRGIASKEDVLAAIDDGACLIDSLSASSYDGSRDGYGLRNGHITSAINVPFHEIIDGETANFKSDAELAAAFHNAPDDSHIITYCGAAIAATVDAFALKWLGRYDVSVYDGSLLEWTADESLPMTDPSSN